MDPKVKEFEHQIELRRAFKDGVRAYHRWLLDHGHLSYKDEDDKQLILHFLIDSTVIAETKYKMPVCDVEGCEKRSVQAHFSLKESWCRCKEHGGR